jgi:hypothetical protein
VKRRHASLNTGGQNEWLLTLGADVVSFGTWLAGQLENPEAAAEYENAWLEIRHDRGHYNLWFFGSGFESVNYSTEGAPIRGQRQFHLYADDLSRIPA